MKKCKRLMTGVLTCALLASTTFSLWSPIHSEAAKKPKLTAKKMACTVGQTKKIRVKNAKKAKISWKAKSKRVVKLKKTGKYAVKVKGLKNGNTSIICKVKIAGKSYKLICKVSVKKNSISNPPLESSSNVEKTVHPAQTAGTDQKTQSTPTVKPSLGPNESPSVIGSELPALPSPSASPVVSVSPAISATPVCSTSAPSVAAVLSQANFETDTDGYTAYGDAKLSVSDNGYAGKCLLISERQASWNGAGMDLTSKLQAGSTYKITAYVKQNSGSAVNIKCMANLDKDSSYPKVGNVSAESGVWTKLSGSITIPEGFQSCVFYFEVENSTIDFYLDSITIKEQIFIETESILKAYEDIFPYMGTCVNYNGFREGAKNQLTTAETLNFIKKHFNSISLEDEMKPSSVINLGWFSTKLTKAEAKEKGYILPDNYTEEYVPELKFDTLDKVLEVAYKNNLKLRGHTLLWHQQTPAAFFTVDYDGNTKVSEEVMNARLEFYIRTVMEHLIQKEKALTGEAGSIIYTWDVANEYLHRTIDPTSVSWMDIYGNQGLEPEYVKKAFQLAYDVLKKYGIEKKVTLLYNDYDTYNAANNVISLIEYINRGESEKICAGVGMQSHMSVSYPTVQKYASAVSAFAEAGLEIQVTELDIGYDTTQGQTEQNQADTYKGIMEALVKAKKDGANITGVTVWGILDIGSWRAATNPLLFAETIGEPKLAFYTFIEAAKSWN